MTNETAPKRSESDVYDRQIRLWGAEAQVNSPRETMLIQWILLSSNIYLRD